MNEQGSFSSLPMQAVTSGLTGFGLQAPHPSIISVRFFICSCSIHISICIFLLSFSISARRLNNSATFGGGGASVVRRLGDLLRFGFSLVRRLRLWLFGPSVGGGGVTGMTGGRVGSALRLRRLLCFLPPSAGDSVGFLPELATSARTATEAIARVPCVWICFTLTCSRRSYPVW